jgi:hypothetical protein
MRRMWLAVRELETKRKGFEMLTYRHHLDLVSLAVRDAGQTVGTEVSLSGLVG